MFEPTHLLSSCKRRVAGDCLGALVAQVQQNIQEMQADAGNQNGRYGHQRNALTTHRTVASERGADESTFVFAKQFFNAFEGNGVHVPGVTREVVNLVHRAVMGGVEPVVHAGRKSQCDKVSIAPGIQIFFFTQQVFERVRKPLGLKYLGSFNGAVGSHNGIYRTAQGVFVVIDAARSVLELSRETVMHAGEVLLFCIAKVEITKEFPDGNRSPRDPRVFDFAEAPHPLGEPATWQSVGQQEVQVFLGQQVVNEFFHCHVSGFCNLH